jgi:PAS domain S-box-containing protein
MSPSDRPIHVLVVDDDPDFADLIATMLERENSRFEVHPATTTEEGLETIESERIDCVVSDYRMQKTDGLSFLETIRDEYGDLPFVLLTGAGDEGVASDAISAGVTDYIQKQKGTDQYSLLANRLVDAVKRRRTREMLQRRNQELKQLNNRFESFVRHSPDVITILSGDGVIQYNSPAIENVLGHGQDDLVGERAIEHVHPEDREPVRETFERLADASDEAHESFEYRRRHADGSWVWLESIASNRTGQDGDRFLINSRDISDRKTRERELEAKTERLEQFASIVSHDLQSPLMVADARLDLALDDCDSKHLPPIADALTRMDEIIDATLTLAREGQVVDETKPVDLAEATERWVESVESTDMTLCVEPDSLVVEADRERLRRVVENLLANAVEHGGKEVTVVVDEIGDGDGFQVSDDGPGVPEEQRDEIFDPGHSMSPDGNGFGLAIVEEIVEAHGWTIEVNDSESGGACFEITGVAVL